MKTISVPLIVLYAVLEGVFLGAFSQVMEQRWPGIVMTAVVATLCTFAGMFVGYRFGIIKVTSRSRKIFGMAMIGYLLFSVVNVIGLMFGWTSGWGFGGSGLLGIGISLLGVGLASYSLAVDFDDIGTPFGRGCPRRSRGSSLSASSSRWSGCTSRCCGSSPSCVATDGWVTSTERELQRVVERWRQLPLDHALSRMPVVRPVVQGLADAVADVEGRPHVEVPDLGPARGHGPADGGDLRRGAGRSRPGAGARAAAARPQLRRS